MIEFYPQIRFVHIACVVLSGALFLLRGSGVLAGARWPMLLPLRIASYSIDTVLLTAALMLLTILPGGVFANGWLTVKLVLLIVYIVLGSFALKRARARSAKAGYFTAAVATYLFMYSIARTHDPLGIFRMLPG
ncbi:MAG: SirB2 family protein [Xanthomonadales bacterium]|nr:SirB2 family protein [Xanthomonadales bacterium]